METKNWTISENVSWIEGPNFIKKKTNFVGAIDLDAIKEKS